MSEIVIKYKEETLDTDNFTEREKAIYSAGYNDGANKNTNLLPNIAVLFMVVIFFIAIIKHMV